MCCCCCPPAISALFCLWFQSGCSKGTVAGALTFFPPEPALYQFERHTADGRVLAEDEDAPLPKEEATKNNKKKKKGTAAIGEDSDEEDVGVIDDGSGRSGPLEIQETREQTDERMKSPIEQLTEQAQLRRKRAKVRNERDARDVAARVHYKLLLDPRLLVPPHDEHAIHAVKIPSPKGVYIAAVIYKLPRQSEDTKTILISHGNATDNGAMFPIQVVLAHALECNVVSYDYSGYGESGGVPDEYGTYRDMDAVFDYTVDQMAAGQPERVILYGQSVGSGPCCHLASQPDEVVGGMILHSPFTSGMRVLTPSRALACLDIYPNIDRIQKVKCPVMVIHGCLDQEVDVSHGQELHNAVPREFQRPPWWVPDRGHNDITDGPGRLSEYVRRLRGFLNSL